MKPTILQFTKNLQRNKIYSKHMATPKMAGHSHLILVLPNQVKTKFSAQEKNTNIANSSGRKNLCCAPIKYRWVITRITCHSFCKAAITAQSRHQRNHIRGLQPPATCRHRGPWMHCPQYNQHLYSIFRNYVLIKQTSQNILTVSQSPHHRIPILYSQCCSAE